MKKDKSTFEQLQNELGEKSRDIWLAGLGVLSVAEQEGGKLFKDFVSRGQKLIKEGESLEQKAIEFGLNQQEELTHKATDMLKFIEDKLHSAIDAVGISSSSDVKNLSKKVDEMSANVARLVEQLEKGNKKGK